MAKIPKHHICRWVSMCSVIRRLTFWNLCVPQELNCVRIFALELGLELIWLRYPYNYSKLSERLIHPNDYPFQASRMDMMHLQRRWWTKLVSVLYTGVSVAHICTYAHRYTKCARGYNHKNVNHMLFALPYKIFYSHNARDTIKYTYFIYKV